jgi:hypothetical protein
MLGAVVLAFLTTATAALPDGNAFVQGLAAKQRAREELLNQYTYDSFNVKEDLDGDDAVKERHTRVYEVFHVLGRPVRRLVSEDGRRLEGKERAEADKRVEEQLEKIRKSAPTGEEDAVKLSEVLDRYDFRSVARDTVDGRPTLVLEFTPRPGKRDIDGDGQLRKLAGRIWVDETDHQLARAEIHNLGSLKLGWGLLASVGELRLRIDFQKVNGEAWLPMQEETLVSGRALLFLKGFRIRITRSFGNYRRFAVEVEEQPATPP